MSSRDNTPQDESSTRGERRSSSRRRQNVVEFVDSQDPNVRSTIQRHTAYHSAAQRRETRSRLLQRASQTRIFEWGRRPPRLDTETSTSSATSSHSISPVPSLPDRLDLSSVSSNNLESDLNQSMATSRNDFFSTQEQATLDDSILQFCALLSLRRLIKRKNKKNPKLTVILVSANFCPHCRDRGVLDTAIAYMREHEVSRNLLLAYAYAARWKLHSSPETVQDQVDAQTHFGRGTNLLWNRLRAADHASSDSNIQAVLLLLAYTADFGQENEVHLHARALQTMIEQRGGVEAMGHNPTLQHQLRIIRQSRRLHLTLDCEPSCPSALRFPDGLQSALYTDLPMN
ncbi:uncharacterized protein PV06_06017 [Exophiala oligosperma]|uniref:Uncharacterized protein n=1 Tax=Exophiala oligosperma TaxID=215243 RepID=A0A0D2E3W5_9EURO|nr:uncharacterized protein PV06_06017 [Exophiala oligosperma]KIW42469.1 hypothetical protein PV06_06017 [Exophiala oligosperma]